MKSSVLVAVLCAMCLAFLAVPANAQATRTWVSGVGDDANPCSRTAPCKTWPGAISKTAAGGEIDALDPGGFGAVTITKAITLDGGGGQIASVLVSGTNGIVVAAGATDQVILRNLRINGVGQSISPGLNAIRFVSGGVLAVEHCDIFDFANSGIDFEPASPSTATKLLVSDVHILNTATATGNAAILIKPASGVTANVAISDAVLDNQINGIFADGSASGGATHVNVTNSVITHSTNNGITISGASFTGDVFSSQISYNLNVGAAVGTGSLKLGNNNITNNLTGVATGGGTLQSFKNNQISDNVTDGTPITAVPGYSGTGQ